MKVAILYCTHIINDNLLFFIKNGYYFDKNVDFYFCFNNVDKYVNYFINKATNIFIHHRKNIGSDFGGWSDVLFTYNIYEKYDYFIFVNSSCIGPILPVYVKEQWPLLFIHEINNEIKMVGSTINFEYGNPHVQTFAFCTDKIGLKIGLDNNIFIEPSKIPVDKNILVQNHEIGYSKKILKAGYNIKCMMRIFNNIDFRTLKKKILVIDNFFIIDDMLYPRGYLGTNVQPYEIIFFKTERNIDNLQIRIYKDIYDSKNIVNVDNISEYRKILIDKYDWIAYIKNNADLAHLKTIDEGLDHFMNHGYKEGRKLFYLENETL